MGMFKAGDIVKVLIPNVANAGYDYRLTAAADIGQFVACRVMNRPYIGVVWGIGDSGLPAEKIKDIITVYDARLAVADLQWIAKMSSWTLMSLGAVLRLIVNVPDAFLPPKMEQLYGLNITDGIRMTAPRQAVVDAFASNDDEPMSASDIQNIAHVSATVVRTMIGQGLLVPREQRASVSAALCRDITYRDCGNIKLNTEQQSAADAIGAAIDAGGFSVHLLDGITGSGKTQVYFDAAWRA